MALAEKNAWVECPETPAGSESGNLWLLSDQSLFGSWSDLVKQTFGRQIDALMKDQEERAFLATGHGSFYAAANSQKSRD